MAYALQMRQELDRIATNMRAVTARAEAQGNRGLTSEEVAKWQAMRQDYERIEASVKIAEKNDFIEESLSRTPGGVVTIDDTSIERIQDSFRLSPAEKRRRESERDPQAKAFGRYVRNGMEALETGDRELMQSRFLPNFAGAQNNMSTTSGPQGGFVVPQGFSGMLEDAKKWFGGIAGTVGKFTTGTGNPFPWPTINDTSNRGRIIGQNVQVVETDLVFGQVTFQAYIGSSDLVLIPLALMQDSFFDLDQLLANVLGIRLGRLFNWKCTAGTGSSEPTGIAPAVVASGNILTLSAGNTASIGYNNLVDLQHSVDPAYRENTSSKWMFSDTMLKLLKKLVDGSNRPLWQPGLTASFQQGAAVMEGAKPQILGNEYVINNDMDIPAANAYSMLFGDLSTFKVREVAGGTTLLRLTERWADYLQVGFIAFQRLDSQLVNAGTNPIAVLRQSAA